jgi:hypothetical protein
MEVDNPHHLQVNSHQNQGPINANDGIKELIQCLGGICMDKAFTNFLQQDKLAQVVVGQLLDKTDGLQKEATNAKCTAITLVSHMAGESCKRLASPTDWSLEDLGH